MSFRSADSLAGMSSGGNRCRGTQITGDVKESIVNELLLMQAMQSLVRERAENRSRTWDDDEDLIELIRALYRAIGRAFRSAGRATWRWFVGPQRPAAPSPKVNRPQAA